MPIPVKRVKVNLKQATPTQLTTDALRTQLQNVGLNCSQLTEQFLTTQIAIVKSQLPMGRTQAYGIAAPTTSPTVTAVHLQFMAAEKMSAAQAENTGGLSNVANANWEPSDTGAGYRTYLSVIAYPEHFQWLAKQTGEGFTGTSAAPYHNSGYYANAEAIQNLFVNACLSASSTLVKGLDQSTMQATLSNLISPLQNASLSNYNVTDSRFIYLVDNYDPTTQEADGIGVLYIGWTLKIEDYKRKTKDGGDTHNVSLDINSGSVLYTDLNQMCKDYNAVVKQFAIPNPDNCPN